MRKLPLTIQTIPTISMTTTKYLQILGPHPMMLLSFKVDAENEKVNQGFENQRKHPGIVLVSQQYYEEREYQW